MDARYDLHRASEAKFCEELYALCDLLIASPRPRRAEILARTTSALDACAAAQAEGVDCDRLRRLLYEINCRVPLDIRSYTHQLLLVAARHEA